MADLQIVYRVQRGPAPRLPKMEVLTGELLEVTSAVTDEPGTIPVPAYPGAGDGIIMELSCTQSMYVSMGQSPDASATDDRTMIHPGRPYHFTVIPGWTIAARLASATPMPGDGGATEATLAAIEALMDPMDVVPLLTDAGHLTVTMNADGTTYTAFASQACKQLTILNTHAYGIRVQQDAAGAYITIPAGQVYTCFGIANANEIGVAPDDGNLNSDVVRARWES